MIPFSIAGFLGRIMNRGILIGLHINHIRYIQRHIPYIHYHILAHVHRVEGVHVVVNHTIRDQLPFPIRLRGVSVTL
jgi:hypothetical protein